MKEMEKLATLHTNSGSAKQCGHYQKWDAGSSVNNRIPCDLSILLLNVQKNQNQDLEENLELPYSLQHYSRLLKYLISMMENTH